MTKATPNQHVNHVLENLGANMLQSNAQFLAVDKGLGTDLGLQVGIVGKLSVDCDNYLEVCRVTLCMGKRPFHFFEWVMGTNK